MHLLLFLAVVSLFQGSACLANDIQVGEWGIVIPVGSGCSGNDVVAFPLSIGPLEKVALLYIPATANTSIPDSCSNATQIIHILTQIPFLRGVIMDEQAPDLKNLSVPVIRLPQPTLSSLYHTSLPRQSDIELLGPVPISSSYRNYLLKQSQTDSVLWKSPFTRAIQNITIFDHSNSDMSHNVPFVANTSFQVASVTVNGSSPLVTLRNHTTPSVNTHFPLHQSESNETVPGTSNIPRYSNMSLSNDSSGSDPTLVLLVAAAIGFCLALLIPMCVCSAIMHRHRHRHRERRRHRRRRRRMGADDDGDWEDFDGEMSIISISDLPERPGFNRFGDQLIPASWLDQFPTRRFKKMSSKAVVKSVSPKSSKALSVKPVSSRNSLKKLSLEPHVIVPVEHDMEVSQEHMERVTSHEEQSLKRFFSFGNLFSRFTVKQDRHQSIVETDRPLSQFSSMPNLNYSGSQVQVCPLQPVIEDSDDDGILACYDSIKSQGSPSPTPVASQDLNHLDEPTKSTSTPSDDDVDSDDNIPVIESLGRKFAKGSYRATSRPKSLPPLPLIGSTPEKHSVGTGQTSPASGTADHPCMICLEPFEDEQLVRDLPCQHSFHASCIDPWLTTSASYCPLCKMDMIESLASIISESSLSRKQDHVDGETQSVPTAAQHNIPSNVVLSTTWPRSSSLAYLD